MLMDCKVIRVCIEYKWHPSKCNPTNIISIKVLLIIYLNREGRVDLFVQSCDKNLMVPVSGAIVAGFNKDTIMRVAQIYPGRASISPTLDVFMTLLSLGSLEYLQLVKQRKDLYVYLRHEMNKLAERHGERVIENVNNTISIGNVLYIIYIYNMYIYVCVYCSNNIIVAFTN